MLQPIGHEQGTDNFLESDIWTRGGKEKGRLLRYEILKVSALRNRLILFFSVALILMGAWQQIF